MRPLLIVGAGSGLSASLARKLSREGLKIALAARSTNDLGSLGAEPAAKSFACDASDPRQVARLFEDVSRTIGSPDVVIYNAGARVRGAITTLIQRRSSGRWLWVPLAGSLRSRRFAECFRGASARSSSPERRPA